MDSFESTWTQVLEVKNRQKQALKYALANFMNIYRKSEYLNLDKYTLIQLLESDYLQVDNEEIVFDCVTNWIKNNEGSAMFSDFLNVIRFPLLSTKFLIKKVLPFCYQYNLSSPYIEEAFTWKYLPNKLKENRRMKSRKIKLKNHFLAIGFNNLKEDRNTVELYNAVENTWRKLKNLKVDAKSIGATIFRDRLIIAGGLDTTKHPLNMVREVNLLTGEMISLVPMNKKRSGFRLVVVGEGKSSSLFAIGGFSSNGVDETVERWDPNSNEWKFVSPMNIKRRYFAAAVLDNKIYVVGNYIPDNSSCDLEVYHVDEDRWEIKSKMKTNRSYCSAVIVDKRMYVMGGFSGSHKWEDLLNTVDCYDIEKNTWTSVANTLVEGHIGAGVLRNSPVAMGGWGDNGFKVEVYDSDENKWNKLGDLVEQRSGSAIVQLPQSLNDLKFDW